MMSSRFDWLSDDESSWKPELANPPSESKRRRKRSISRILLALALIAVPAGIIILLSLNRKIDSANVRVTADVIAAHNLVKQALNTGDIDPELTGCACDFPGIQGLEPIPVFTEKDLV